MLKLFKLDPHFIYHYLCLQRMDLVKEYVQAVPMFRKMFFKFKEHCDEFIDNLHTAYLVKLYGVEQNNYQKNTTNTQMRYIVKYISRPFRKHG